VQESTQVHEGSERKAVPLEQSEGNKETTARDLPWDGAISGFRLSIYLGGYLTMHLVSRY
jgi:hypothetical protein